LKQRVETIDAATVRFRLTPDERQLLLGADRGEGLVPIRGNRIPIQIVASNTGWPRPTHATWSPGPPLRRRTPSDPLLSDRAGSRWRVDARFDAAIRHQPY